MKDTSKYKITDRMGNMKNQIEIIQNFILLWDIFQRSNYSHTQLQFLHNK